MTQQAALRWWVFGAAGMLGVDLVDVLRQRGADVVTYDRTSADITDATATAALEGEVDVVVNCAAWTAVDDAEVREADAFRVNAVGAANVARLAHRLGARVVHVSTDYVFDGAAQRPYAADAPLDPRSAYGRTKAAGEWAVRAEAPDHLIVRTAYLYGAHGQCFPRTIARLVRERGSLQVVADQVGQPTWTRDVASLVADLVDASAPAGAYHATSGGLASWHDFARAVVAADGGDPDVVAPTTSAEFVRPAPRPAYSVLSHASVLEAGVQPIGDWEKRWQVAAHDVLA
jgi:dTDP-4-dehydrorhamnose reductase